MTNIDYTALIQAIITLVSLIITGFLIPLLRKKLSNEKLDELKKWVRIAVSAAEQLYGSKTGQQKKEFVVAFLLSKGIVFDVDEVNALIESEVYKLTSTDFT
ncbi:MAG: holin [Clostridia bacterium]|nr:holin [Clostridia bacterium]